MKRLVAIIQEDDNTYIMDDMTFRFNPDTQEVDVYDKNEYLGGYTGRQRFVTQEIWDKNDDLIWDILDDVQFGKT